MRTLLLAGLILGISGAGLAATGPYAGAYQNSQVVIEIRTAGAGKYTGVIRAHGEEFRFTAREKAGTLTGDFLMDGEKVEFRATLKGKMLIFATEEESYTLTKQQGRASDAGKASGSSAARSTPAQSARTGQSPPLRINRVTISDDEVRKLERDHRMQLPRGDFWYDRISGAWGREGGPTLGATLPGIKLGGPLRSDASRGNTGVFINGRELPMQDVLGLQQISVPVMQGRWWVDSAGNVGMEGNPVPIGNLFQFSRGKGGAYQRSTGGGYIGGDGQQSYFFDPKSGSSVMVGN
jgi:hypothetical protein